MIDLTDVLDWGSLDINALEKRISEAEKIGVTLDDIKDYVEDLENKTDINTWIYATLNCIFQKTCDLLKEEFPEKESIIESWEDDYSPFINYLDSWQNNELDEIDFDSNNWKEELISILNERYQPLISK